MAERQLADWLAYIERAHPSEIELGLGRVRTLAERLALVAPTARTLTVAGTNGKGSCVTAASALLRRADLKVGTYTSPHFLNYRERIRIDGECVADGEIVRAFEAIERVRDDISLTYFEYGTLAALWLFRERGVDVQVLEVGLGGRLDAVNVIDPDVAVVTSIALDHQSWLGDDRETIGAEKAGIFRPHRPAICADPEPPASIARVAKEQGAALMQLGQDFSLREDGDGWRYNGELALPVLSLPAPSVAAALRAIEALDVRLPAASIRECLGSLTLAGRMQRLEWRGVPVLLDVAHNPAATTYLARRLTAEGWPTVHAVVAMMSDKDIPGSLVPLADSVDHWYAAELADQPRAAGPAVLARELAALGHETQMPGAIAECLESARRQMGEGELLLVCGSFFTVSAALAILTPEQTGE